MAIMSSKLEAATTVAGRSAAQPTTHVSGSDQCTTGSHATSIGHKCEREHINSATTTLDDRKFASLRRQLTAVGAEPLALQLEHELHDQRRAYRLQDEAHGKGEQHLQQVAWHGATALANLQYCGQPKPLWYWLWWSMPIRQSRGQQHTAPAAMELVQ